MRFDLNINTATLDLQDESCRTCLHIYNTAYMSGCSVGGREGGGGVSCRGPWRMQWLPVCQPFLTKMLETDQTSAVLIQQNCC